MDRSLKYSLASRAEDFRILHQRPGIFVVPNPWDAGSARMLESLGFKALATTSAGLAFSLGKADGRTAVTREESLQNVQSIIAATTLPVSGDLENGYGDDPATCAETVLLAASAGLAGGSIEDATGRIDDPIYPFELAVERVRAAVEASRNLPYPFVLTARAENLINDRPDLNDTIRRLEAFAEAGADVLFAPGLKTLDEIAAVVKAVYPKPVNVLMGLSGVNLSLEKLESAGVKRVSVGSSLIRAAFGAFFRAAREIKETGTFTFSNTAISYADMNSLFEGFSQKK
ncbi:MAG: isocitrate lyase/phosphoenolpyruvate mutase family protein [Chitinophagaceae bacterium]|nr:isocitrate lyase/phosphoenolpyruvate mutase family protein [Chitinophagaceae bacterium]